MDELIGQQIGHYTIERLLGRGGMASVFLATDPSMERDVAIKILPREFASDPMYLERFKREVKVIAKLNHPNIVPVHAFGETDGWTYIVMAYMSGGTLGGHIRKMGNTIPMPTIASYLDQIGSGMDFAHSRGVIHRDFKPGNVLMGDRAHLALSDFGIAKMAESTMSLTGTGMLGTPAYMAPELATKGGLSHLVDIYALGVTLYEMVTGHMPFEADTPMGLLMAHMANPVPDARYMREDVTAEVQAVIEKCMIKDPALRYQSAQELADEFRKAIGGSASAPASATAPATAAEDDGLYTLHTPPPLPKTPAQPSVQPTMRGMKDVAPTAIPEPGPATDITAPTDVGAATDVEPTMEAEPLPAARVEPAVVVKSQRQTMSVADFQQMSEEEQAKKRASMRAPEPEDLSARPARKGLSLALIAGGVLALIVIAAGAFFVTGGAATLSAMFAPAAAASATALPPTDRPTSVASAQPTLVSLSPTAKLLYGSAEIRATPDGDYHPLTGGEALTAGMSIRTANHSAVLLVFGEGVSAEAHDLTEVTISRMSADATTLHIELQQLSGTTYHFIDQGAFGLQQDYIVTAPNTLTKATGTQFWVSEASEGWYLFPDVGVIDIKVGDPASPSGQFIEDAAAGGCLLVDRRANTTDCVKPRRLVALTNGSTILATVTPNTVAGGPQPTTPPGVTAPPPTAAGGGGAVCTTGWLPAAGCTCCGSTLVCSNGTIAPSNPQCTGGGGCSCVNGVSVGAGCANPGGAC